MTEILNNMQKKIYLLSAIILCSFFKLTAQVGFNLQSQSVSCGQTITFPVTVDNFNKITGVQYSINWDTSQVAFDPTGLNITTDNLENNDRINISPNFVEKGQLTFAWFDLESVTLDDNDTINLFTFTIVGTNFNSTSISFVDNPTFIEVTDSNGISTPFDVTNAVLTLEDTETPTIICPSAQSAILGAGSTTAIVSGLLPNANDNCALASVTYELTGATTGTGTDDASGQTFNEGITTVTYTATDFKGNSNICSFEVNVGGSGPIDTVAVSVTSVTEDCGNMVSIPITGIQFDSVTSAQLTLSWNPNQFTFSAVDNFGLAGLTAANFDVTQANTGTITLNWSNATPQTSSSLFNLQLTPTGLVSSATILLSNLSIERNNVTFPNKGTNGEVTIQDISPPSLTCPGNIIQAIDAGQIIAVVTGLAPTVSDNCGEPTVTYQLTGATTGGGNDDASGTSFEIGTTTVTYTAVDDNGGSTSCSFTVTVSSTAPTNFTLIAQSQSADCSANELFVDIAVAAFDSIAGTQFSVNWDPAVLTYARIADINTTIEESSGFDSLDIATGKLGYTWFNANTATLPDGIALFRIYFTPNGSGTTPVTFTGIPTPIEINQKENGNFMIVPMDSITLTAGTVTLLDNTAPTITCPDDVVFQVPMGQINMAINGLDPVVDDNCGVASVTYTLSGATIGSGMNTASGQNFNAGTTTVTYTVTDGSGNEQQCSSTVTISVPSALLLNVVNEAADCGNDLFKVDIKVDSFDSVLGLQFSVDWDENVLAYDSVGNFGLAEFSSSNFTVNFMDNGKLGFAWFDDRAQGLQGETLADGTTLFCIFFKVVGDAGTSTSILIADDPVPREGNVKTTNSQMIVPVIGNSGQANVVDNTPPTVTNSLPDTILLYLPADTCSVIGGWTEPTFSDACSSNMSLQRSDDPNAFYTVGESTISYTATDMALNATTSSAVLIVRDTTGPVFMNCPADIMIEPNENCEAIANWIEPDAADNCSEIVIVSSTHTPNTNFLAGTTTVTYFAEDVYGNESTCSFNIVVEGGAAAIIFEGFPSNITIDAAQNQCGAEIGWTPPTASGGCDNGSSITINSSNQPNDFFPVGTTAVIYTATDGSGTTKMDTFNVTVIDNQELAVLCPTDIEIQADGTVMSDELNFINTITSDTCGEYIITFNDITVIENCSPITITQTQGIASGGAFTFGTTMMEFMIADTLGSPRTCTFQIKINESADLMASAPTSPVCAGVDIQLTVDTLIGGSYQWSGPGGFLANLQNPVIINAMTQNSGDYIVKVISTNLCTVKDTVRLGIRSSPIVEASGTNIGCTSDAEPIQLTSMVTNGIPIDSYSWTGPGNYMSTEQNPTINDPTVSDAGIYIVTGTNAGSGCAGTDTVVVDIQGMVTPTLTSSAASDTICAGDSFTLTGTQYEGFVSYSWIADVDAGLPANTDTNVITITPTIPGDYIYSYSANLDGGCISDTVRISMTVVDATNITLSSNGPFDCVAATEMIDLMATGGTGIISYSWTGPNAFTSNEQNPSLPVSNAASGTYILSANTVSGCVKVDSITVMVTAQGTPPEVTLSSTGNNVCAGDALAITAEDIIDATYEWTGPNGFTSTDRVVVLANISDQSAGAYQVRYTVNGCISAPRTVGPIGVLADPIGTSDEYEVEVNQALTFDVLENDQILAGAPFTITIVSEPQHGTLTNNMDGTFSYQSNTNFLVVDQFAYEFCYVDCPDACVMETITMRTKLSDILCIAPTVITPNGDGMNDVFQISCVPDPPKQGSELIVFNEWGSEVFRESPYQNNWQGQYKGKDLPDGTYYYIFKEDSDDNDPKKGYFSLFR